MAHPSKEIVLITGANTGLGFQIAKKLLTDHSNRFYIFLGARTPSKGEAAVKDLHDQGLTQAEAIEIDVSNNESIARAAKTVEEKVGRVDVLHINAGIAPDTDWQRGVQPISGLLKTTFDTNVAGAAQTMETFVPLLEKAENPRVIWMSSGLGSLARAKSGTAHKIWPGYAPSKAALNMVMLWFAGEYPGWKINSCAPGFRATQMNNMGAAVSSSTPGKLEDGALNAVRLSLLGKDGETGTYTMRKDDTGEIVEIPW